MRSHSGGPALSGLSGLSSQTLSSSPPTDTASPFSQSQSSVRNRECMARGHRWESERESPGSHAKITLLTRLGGSALGVICSCRMPLSDQILASISKIIIAMQLVWWASGGGIGDCHPSHIDDDEAVTRLQPVVTIASCLQYHRQWIDPLQFKRCGQQAEVCV